MMTTDCLTLFQQQLVLSLFPEGAEIENADWMQSMRPCPVAVDIRVPGKSDLERVVLRRSRNRGGVEREALVLPELFHLGLPVPQILAGPIADAEIDETVSVLSFLPGIRLQDCVYYPETPLLRARELAIESIQILHKVTDAMQESSVATLLPRRTLWDEWVEQRDRAGVWNSQAEYTESLFHVEFACRNVSERTLLVFSNGDYQPGNFLTDGERITGLLDFEKAGFIDPLINVARYPVYGLEPLNSAGIATAFCDANHFTSSDLALRIVVFGLRTIRTKLTQDENPNSPRAEFRDQLFGLIRKALEEVEGN